MGGDNMNDGISKTRTQWDPKELSVVREALKEFGAGEDCAKYILAELPKTSPRMILNAAKRYAERVDAVFVRMMQKAHVRWVRKKYYTQVNDHGEWMVGITVVRRRLAKKFSRKHLEKIGAWPVPLSSMLRDWLKTTLDIEGTTVNGALVYPIDEVLRRAQNPMTSALSGVQLDLPDTQTGEPEESKPPVEDEVDSLSDEKLFERVIGSRRKRLVMEKELAELEVQRLASLLEKAKDTLRLTTDKLRIFESKMDVLIASGAMQE